MSALSEVSLFRWDQCTAGAQLGIPPTFPTCGTGEAIQGGSEKVGEVYPALGTSNCQEMLQADLQKLKEDRKNLRKAIRNNQKKARKQAKRKQRLVKAVLTVVFVFLQPVLAASRQDVVEGRPGAVDSGQTGGFHLTNECGHFFASQDQEATTEERTFEVKVCQLLTHGLFVSFPAVTSGGCSPTRDVRSTSPALVLSKCDCL